jgi:hypothetical protein
MTTEEIIKLLDDIINFIEGVFEEGDEELIQGVKTLKTAITAHWG